MSIKSSYPTMINGTAIPSADSWSVDSQVIETEFMTEAGTDEVLVSRYGKVTVTAKFTVSAKWLATFQGYSTRASLTVKYYDPALAGYAEKTMRLRNFRYVLIPGSDKLDESMGLYTVNFDLIEF